MIALIVVGVLVALALALYVHARWVFKDQSLEEWVRPAAQVLADNLPKSGPGTEDGGFVAVAQEIRLHPTRYVRLPRRFPIPETDLKSHVVCHLPVSPGSNERTKDRIVKDLAERLKLGSSPSAEWMHRGHGAELRIWPTPSFGEPRTVYDYMPAIEAERVNAHRVVLGLDLDGNPVVYDHVTMGPHLKASAGSGGGKSNLYRFLVPQYIGSGCQVVILDVKGVSMLDLAVSLKFRNIKYYSEAETCHNAFQAVFAELERRRKADIRARLQGESIKFTPLHVVMEEANTLMAMLKDFWEYAKQAHEEAARHSPAVRSMHYTVYMGREFGIYIHVIAQRAEAAVFGGGAVRENFNAALMSKWDMRTWKMLAHGHKYIPHPMDWSWYLVTSVGVTRYLPPSLQESDAALIADLDNVPQLEWAEELEAVPDVQVTSAIDYVPGPTQLSGLPQVELAVTVTLKEAHALICKHGHCIPLSVMEQWQKGGNTRSATAKGYAEWPEPVGNNGRAKVYKRTDIINWMLTGPEPVGYFWDGQAIRIKRTDLELKPHTIYGLKVVGYGDVVSYVGQTHQQVETRVEQHKSTQYWGDLVQDVVSIYEGVMTCIEARELEAYVTEILGTRLNRPIPQVGMDVEPKWNPAAESAEDLKMARHIRDREAGKPAFTLN